MSLINSPPNLISNFNKNSSAFWQFSRPHTVIGTSLSILALFLIYLADSGGDRSSISLDFYQYLKQNLGQYSGQLLATWLACLAGNIYIVGLNQLEDIEIDKINKPKLPLASGAFSRKTGQIIVVICGILALVVATISGKFLLLMVAVSLIIGTAYSLPPIRLKRLPLFAALCILVVRGLVVNLGLFLHFKSTFIASNNLINEKLVIPATVWVITWFILVFTIAIALGKDIPDMEGDKKYQINTFTIKLGKTTVFNICRAILTIAYLGIIIAALVWLPQVNIQFLVISHSLGLVLLWWQSWGLDLESQEAIARFYQFIWKLFFMEYLIFPLACLWV